MYLETKKLPIILDLDHTLLHTIKRDHLVSSCSLSDIKDCYQFTIEGDGDYCVKFRPGIAKFLDRLSQLFEIHVYTMGTRKYTESIIDLIVHQLLNGVSVFNGKIVTRSETGKDIKLLNNILPGQEHLALILDDSPKIWKAFKNHVVPIYPYRFFMNVDEQMFTVNLENEENFAPLHQNQPDSEKMGQIVCSPNDNHLRSMYHVLASVHQHFFKTLKTSETLNIKENLKWRRFRVLSGVHLLFSGVFPLGTDPKIHPLWKNSEYFGAKCHDQFNDSITHLVAARDGTDKVIEAVRRGTVYIIIPNWLWDSVAHWVRLPENDFNLLPKYNLIVKHNKTISV